MTAREYKLYLTRQQKLSLILPAVMFTIFPILIYFTFPFRSDGQQDLFPFFFWLFAAFAWYGLLTVPHRLIVTSDGALEFVALVRKRRISIHDIVSIAPGGMGPTSGYMQRFKLNHRTGSVGFINQFTGMHEFLAELRRSNPQVELLGC